MIGEPDFIIAGAHKCGTTSLMRALEQHSEVERPTADEPHTLIRDTYSKFRRSGEAVEHVADWDRYAQMHNGQGKTADGSVLYLTHHSEFLANYVDLLNSAPPVIVVLRRPSLRAWSAFNYARLLNPDEGEAEFSKALDLGEARWLDPQVSSTLSYLKLSTYASSVAALKGFLGEKLLVLLFEEMVSNFEEVSPLVQAHIGLKPETLALGTSNQGGEWKNGPLKKLASNSALRTAIRRSRSRLKSLDHLAAHAQRSGTRSVKIEDDVKKSLDALFESDICELEDVLGRDLSIWRA